MAPGRPGRPRSQWEDRVYQHLAEDESRKPASIRQLLLEWVGEFAAAAGATEAETNVLRKKVPPPSTIAGISERYFAMDPDERVIYGSTRWPQSFGTGGLPWEAAAAFIELQTYLNARQVERRAADLRADEVRASVRVTRWYWRVCQAATGLHLEPRWKLRVAIRLAAADAGVVPDAVKERADAEATLLGQPLSRQFEGFEMRYSAAAHDIWMAHHGAPPPSFKEIEEAYSDGSR